MSGEPLCWRVWGNLPPPFLRRCVYYFIRFPNDPAVLKQIVE
jgi:hypothetical protein